MTAKLMTTALATSTERIFRCADGLQLAAQCYRPPAATPSRNKVLMLHGWLDNCRSFWKLAPHLKEDHVVALDFPGHGKSQHKAKDGTPAILAEGIYYIADVLQQLEWKSDVTLIGHSMGAAMALGYAATFPEQVHQLILLEGAGPLARDASDTTKHMRAHIERRLRGNVQLYGDNAKGPRVYPSVQKAAETRQASATMAPGNQYLSLEAATELVHRAVTPKDGITGGVSFHHDARLMWPSLLYMTHDQVASLQRAIQCPTCLLLAEDGWPFDAQRLEDTKERLGLTRFATLPGSHHFHADPETANEVAQQVLDFMQKNTTPLC